MAKYSADSAPLYAGRSEVVPLGVVPSLGKYGVRIQRSVIVSSLVPCLQCCCSPQSASDLSCAVLEHLLRLGRSWPTCFLSPPHKFANPKPSWAHLCNNDENPLLVDKPRSAVSVICFVFLSTILFAPRPGPVVPVPSTADGVPVPIEVPLQSSNPTLQLFCARLRPIIQSHLQRPAFGPAHRRRAKIAKSTPLGLF